nr:ABC transporter substrate-binding protein [Kibdelosporangium sp. MJ126-NF4]CEL20753.1 periplasmic binding protein [Kibdelosporangium sp. MJ126-NF4]CTQ89666.1 periplasmic binding protein [Kibdelosporangium sp. MJ126-NF4]
MLIRRVLPIVLAAALLGGCASTSKDTVPQQPAAQAGGAFPVTIKTAFGDTVIKQKPRRVVSLGLTDTAVANALGADIVATVKYYTGMQMPYLRTKLQDSVISLDADALNMERIAAHKPDVILAISSYTIDKSKFDTLSKIAPVVTYEQALYSSSMEQDALTIGRALGEDERARKLVDEATASIAKLKADLPKLPGKSYLYGQARGDVLPMVVGKENQSTRFMGLLGLKVPDAFADARTSADLAPGTIGLSYENADKLDSADVLFMTFAGPEDKQKFDSNPLTRDLRVIKEGRYQATTIEVAVMLQAPDVVGVDWVLQQLRPTLAKIGS